MAVTSTDQKQDQLNIVVRSTTDQKGKMTNGGNKGEEIGKFYEQQDQLKMVVTSTTDQKGRISSVDNKEEESGKTCEQQDQLKMVVTSTTDQKEKITNGNIKEEEIDKSCDQQDQLQMVVTPPTDQKRKIINSDKKEAKSGTTCHQCRQQIKGLSAHCNNKKKDKPCPNKFCHKCLRNRYGEQAEEKSVLKDWNCPKCRGICNCSVCMKRRGHEPTGILVHTAKANGFSSASELLRSQGPKALGLNKFSKVANEGTRNSDLLDLNNEPSDESPSKTEKENSVVIDLNSHPVSSSPDEKKKKRKRTEFNDLEEIFLPRGTELTTVAGISLPQEDVGHALQFLEFCTAFKEILDLKEREPEYILVELIRGGNGCRGKQSPVIRFHIVLLSMIQDLENESPVLTYKSGKGSWLHALHNCVSRSGALLENLKLDSFNFEADEYESLGSSKRLKLLNFLCDEVLCTVKLRSWIDDQNLHCIESVKVSKERIQAAKQKENQLKLKMQDEVVKAVIANNNGDHLSTSEYDAVVSEIKNEVAQAHAEVLEAKNMAINEDQSCDAARTEPLISDINGHTYWRLKGYADDSNIFLQEVGNCDGSVCKEQWFTVDVEQATVVEELIRSLRRRKVTSQRLKFTYKGDAIL